MPPQVEPAVESPEQLLRSLEAEMVRTRTQRERSQGRRVALLAGGLVLVVAAAAVALTFAFSMLNDLALRDRPGAPTGTESPAPAGGGVPAP